jgi:DNA-binding transcriptional LysR family regulator
VLPAPADGVRNHALPPMEMTFVGHPEQHKKRKYQLHELAEMELLTFKKGSQPHVTLMDLFRQHHIEPKRVHAISSISAMVQLVQGGFGVAVLPRVAVQRLVGFSNLKLLSCDAHLQALPIHASYRTDPSSQAVETVIKSAIAFVEGASNAPKRTPKKTLKGIP